MLSAQAVETVSANLNTFPKFGLLYMYMTGGNFLTMRPMYEYPKQINNNCQVINYVNLAPFSLSAIPIYISPRI